MNKPLRNEGRCIRSSEAGLASFLSLFQTLPLESGSPKPLLSLTKYGDWIARALPLTLYPPQAA